MSNDSISRPKLAAILLCFFLSGAAGLIYQVAWGKSLGLIFGHTVYAVATVIAVFMSGLAVGSAVLGRWSERRDDPVRQYGWIELLIAAAGALSLVGLAGVRALYLASYHAVAGSVPALLALRFFGAALVLFIPTFLMGGTLPILVRGVTRSSTELGARISRLYWVNTLGAVAGTLGAGFILLPFVGLKRTIGVAVALNVLAGLVALALRRNGRAAVTTESENLTSIPTQSVGMGRELQWFLLGTFGLVGATAIAYEVAWTRLLATPLGSSTYAFTLLLATFLVGIVLGSALFEVWIRRRKKEVSLASYALTQTLTGLAALAFLVLFQKIPYVVPPILKVTGESFTGLLLAQFVTSALVMLPTAILFGFNFPLVTMLIAGGDTSSREHGAAVGRAYATNTLGAIVGATLTGFFLVPWLGSFRVVAWTAAANLFLALLLQIRRRPWSIAALALNTLLLGFMGHAGWRNSFYDPALANLNVVLYWDLYEAPLTLREVADTGDLLFVEDGLNSTITVVASEDYISLRTNGKVDASNLDMVTQLIVGQLGATFHPAPRRVLVIGFGSGMTVSALSRFPEVERIDCVEIEPGVLHAAQKVKRMEELNRGVLDDPRVHITLDDGRNFLLTSRERYDLIVSEPSNPWIAGVSALFTDEFYREVRSRLAPGGMLVQWVQAYSLYPEDVRMVLRTLAPHFPQVSVWRAESQDLVLLAQSEPGQLSFDRMRALWNVAGVREDYEKVGVYEPEGLAAFHLLDDADLRALVADAPVNSDDHTLLEYRAPRALLASGLGDKNVELIRQRRSQPLPQVLRVDDRNALFRAMAETFIHQEDEARAAAMLAQVDESKPDARVERLRGRSQLAAGRLSDARASFQRALQIDPSLIEAAEGLAEVERRALNFDKAELLLRQILGRRPGYIPAFETMVRVAYQRDDWPAAVEWQQKLIDAELSPSAKRYADLGVYLLRSRDKTAARQALTEALRRDPYSYEAHRNLAELCRETGDVEGAREHLEMVIRYSPTTDSAAYVALVQVYRSLGRPRDAERVLEMGQRLFPGDTKLR